MSSVRFSPVLIVMTEQPAPRQWASAASTRARPIPPRRTDASTASIPKYPVSPSTRTSTAGRGMGFTADVRRDIRRAVRMGARPVDYLFELSTWIVLSYRVGHAIAGMSLPWRRALRLVHGPIHGFLQIAGGIELPVNAKIGGGLHLRHTKGVGVHPQAGGGMGCNLLQ